MRNELRYYELGSHPLLGRGTTFEKRISFQSASVAETG